MPDRMTVTDIARHIGISRPSAYKIISSIEFPIRGLDGRWDRTDVLNWLTTNTVTVRAFQVGGVLVVTGAE